jgi:glutaredoxin
MLTVQLYGKPACGLCDEAKAALDRVRRSVSFSLQVIDISTDPSLLARFGSTIPLIAIGGDPPLPYRPRPPHRPPHGGFFDDAELERRLRRAEVSA